MGANIPRPSFLRLLWVDYTAFLAVAFPAAMWIITLVWITPPGTGMVSPLGAQILLFGSVFMTVLGGALIVWRFLWLRRLFREGVTVSGKVIRTSFSGDRGEVSFVFALEGQIYQVETLLHRDQRARLLQPGQDVVVLVDAKKPASAILRDLYL